MLEKELGVRELPYPERVHSCSQLSILCGKPIRPQIVVLEVSEGNCKLDSPELPHICSMLTAPELNPARTNVTVFLGGRRFERRKRPRSRWQVASGAQNRAPAAFEV